MLTPRQKQILEILRTQDSPVTTIELQHVMGYRRDSSVLQHLRKLDACGLLKPRPRNAHRMIAISEKGREVLASAA